MEGQVSGAADRNDGMLPVATRQATGQRGGGSGARVGLGAQTAALSPFERLNEPCGGNTTTGPNTLESIESPSGVRTRT